MQLLPFKTFTGKPNKPPRRWFLHCYFVVKKPSNWDTQGPFRNSSNYLPVFLWGYSEVRGEMQGWALNSHGDLKEIYVEPRQLLVPLFRECTGIINDQVYYMSRSGAVEYGRGVPAGQLHIQSMAARSAFRGFITEPTTALALLGQAMGRQTPVISEGKPCVIGDSLVLVPLGDSFTIWWRDTLIGHMLPGSVNEVVMKTGFEQLKGQVLKCIRRARKDVTG